MITHTVADDGLSMRSERILPDGRVLALTINFDSREDGERHMAERQAVAEQEVGQPEAGDLA